MGNINDIRVVLGTLRYKSAPETSIGVKLPFEQTFKENVEFDRSIDIDLNRVFNDERQKSSIFRPTCKFSILFKNSYTGSTNYPPFENNLYYVDEAESAKQQCKTSAENVSWKGFPQYNEFDFIRNDYNVSGYTQPPNNHITFVSKSASTYNWNFFLSYPYSNNYSKPLAYTDSVNGNLINWVSGDGLPFRVVNMVDSGNKIVSFVCPVAHGLSVGEYVKLSFPYNGTEYFEVNSLGDGTSNSDKYVFNIFNYGFTGNTFNNNVSGTFKRVLDVNNPSDTTSEYYVKQLKFLSDVDDSVLVKTGFEQNIFGKTKKYESSAYTPNHVSRVSVKEGSQSYTLSFNTDFDILPLRDNQKRPITELYFNVIWKGYFGWTFGVPNSGLQQGYDYNLPLVNGLPDSWWVNTNLKSKTGFPLDSYTTPLGVNPFTYVRSLKKDDIIDGDYCEWNSYEQKEREMSTLYHKFKFSPYVFDVRQTLQNADNILGYYYKPNYKITIREYSGYIEDGDPATVIDVPDYSHFSTTKNTFIWRDIYPYGYIDSDNVGVNYPFLNGKHYPYKDNIFRIIPEGTNFANDGIIQDPTTDACE